MVLAMKCLLGLVAVGLTLMALLAIYMHLSVRSLIDRLGTASQISRELIENPPDESAVRTPGERLPNTIAEFEASPYYSDMLRRSPTLRKMIEDNEQRKKKSWHWG